MKNLLNTNKSGNIDLYYNDIHALKVTLKNV